MVNTQCNFLTPHGEFRFFPNLPSCPLLFHTGISNFFLFFVLSAFCSRVHTDTCIRFNVFFFHPFGLKPRNCPSCSPLCDWVLWSRLQFTCWMHFAPSPLTGERRDQCHCYVSPTWFLSITCAQSLPQRIANLVFYSLDNTQNPPSLLQNLNCGVLTFHSEFITSLYLNLSNSSSPQGKMCPKYCTFLTSNRFYNFKGSLQPLFKM